MRPDVAPLYSRDAALRALRGCDRRKRWAEATLWLRGDAMHLNIAKEL